MQYVELGKIKDKVSRFGLGCMRLPSIETADGKKEIDDEEAIKLIRSAIDRGVNYIDTAYAYGRSEEVVGKALQDGYREKVTLVTKIPMGSAESHEDLYRIFDEQCRRLQTDYIDVYFLHNMNMGSWPLVKKYDAIKFMYDLKAKGKIKHCGFSMHERPELLEEILDVYEQCDLVMIQYNYLDKFNQAGRRGVEILAERGIPVTVMEPLRGGLLAGEIPGKITEAFGDFHPEMSHVEKSFMWLYNQPEIKVVLSGSSSMEQLDDSLRIFENAKSGVLTEDDEKIYDAARAEWNKMVKVGCTGCAYCVPCPANVNIPEIFRMYNETAKSKNPQKWLYKAILGNAGEDASKCLECGACEGKCPQKIAIIEKLKEADEELLKP